MTVLTLTGKTRELKEMALANNICAYIAEHVGVDAKDVGLATHFNDDLGLDWLDVVELDDPVRRTIRRRNDCGRKQ